MDSTVTGEPGKVEASESRTPAGWTPRPLQIFSPSPLRPLGQRVSSLIPIPYVLVIGPGVVYSVAVTGFVLGLVSPAHVNAIGAANPHIQALCTALALGIALVLTRSALADIAAAARPRLGAIRWQRLLLAAETIGYPACALVVYDNQHIDGLSPLGYCLMALAAIWMLPLLLGERPNVLERQPHKTHAPKARRTFVLSFLGVVLSGPAMAAIQAVFDNVASVGAVHRYDELQPLDPFPPLNHLSAVLESVLLSTANAVLEETIFALIVLALAAAGWRHWTIIALAGLLRAAFHLYYGVAGLGAAEFSMVNAALLLRYRRLLPLIVAHSAYDLLVSAIKDPSIWPSHPARQVLAVIFGAITLITGLYYLDKALRRAPHGNSPIAQAHP